MAFDPLPKAFFGPGYSEAAAAITLNTSEATGVTTGTTFQADATTDVLTFVAAHNLKVGDRVRVTQGTTLPTGLSAATDYWVKTTPAATTLTLSATKGGATLDLTANGTADNTLQAFGPLDEVTDLEIDLAAGDWRKIAFGIVEMLYNRYNVVPAVDKSTKFTVARSSAVSNITGSITRTYTIRVETGVPDLEVADEP